MKQLLKKFNLDVRGQVGLYHYRTNEARSLFALGKYDETTLFDGSDKLSMAVMTSNRLAIDIFKDGIVIGEGDRFTCSTFIKDFSPFIIKINGNGDEGRKKRGSSQSARHIRSIQTRVDNVVHDVLVKDSSCCLEYILRSINDPGSENDENLIIKEQKSDNAFDMFLN